MEENISLIIEEKTFTSLNGINDNIEHIIEVYSIMIQDFMKHMIESTIICDSVNANEIIYNGWKSTTHIFCILYCGTKNLKFTYSKFQRAYLVYLEYIEQTILNGMETPSNNEIVMFLYSKIFSECHSEPSISISQRHFNIKTDLFFQITNITSIIFGWNMQNISNEDRFRIIKTHLHNYLNIMCKPSIFHLHQIIEHVQNKCHMDYSEYSAFLYEFYRYVKKTTMEKSETDVVSICLNKFFCNDIVEIYNKKPMRKFIKWIFME
jgi:hypothetical protein